MRVTIKDIARETGLSPTTVSIVLNNKPHRLSEETRKRVWETAKKMNYRPNSMAASLKTKKTKTVGMIISSFTDAYYGELVSGAEEKCLKEGYALITCTEDASNPKYINLLIDRGVDGIILSGSGFYRNKRQELVEYIQSFGIPVVSADSLMQTDKVMNVCSDNLLGGYRATAYLLELGHTKIGCITGPIEREGMNGSAGRRYRGYQAALKKYGIPFQESYVAHGEFNIQSGMECTPRLIEQGVTAIVAANDLCAYGIYKWAKEHHVRIPEDCSVIGYDDIQYSDFFNPSLTTIRQPAHKVGYESARKIIEYTDEEDGKGQQDIIYQPELIIRESTSAPGKSR